MLAGTLQTDPRSGGIKRSSGVNVLPIVSETWSQVRDDKHTEVDWLIAGYVPGSKTDITVLQKGCGGLEACAKALPSGQAVFGGLRHRANRFVTFWYCDDATSTMQKGRASLHKNGVLNILEGSDCEINIQPAISEADLGIRIGARVGSPPPPPPPPRPPPTSNAPMQKSNIMSKVLPPPNTVRNQKSPTTAVVVGGRISSHSNKTSLPMKNGSSIKTTNVREGDVSSSTSPSIYPTDVVIPYEQLKNNSKCLPTGVDPANRERSLSRSEFETIFGMSPTDFDRLPAWKRTALKKQHGLF